MMEPVAYSLAAASTAPAGAATWWVLAVVVAVIVASIVGATGALGRGRLGWLFGCAAVVLIALVFLARSGLEWREGPRRLAVTAGGTADGVSDRVADGIERATLNTGNSEAGEIAERRFHVVDDHGRWIREQEALKFRSDADARPWLEAASGSRRVTEVIGDTEFVYWIPAPDGTLAAFSPPAADRDSARRQAQGILGAKLAALALVELKRRHREVNVDDVAPLARRLARRWQSHRGAGSVESTRRSYGTMYRTAVRLRLEDGWLDRAVHELEAEIQRGWIAKQEQARAWVTFGATVVCIAFLLFLLYTFFNAGTKGYLAWPLRIVSAAVFLAICVAVYWLRVHTAFT